MRGLEADPPHPSPPAHGWVQPPQGQTSSVTSSPQPFLSLRQGKNRDEKKNNPAREFNSKLSLVKVKHKPINGRNASDKLCEVKMRNVLGACGGVWDDERLWKYLQQEKDRGE